MNALDVVDVKTKSYIHGLCMNKAVDFSLPVSLFFTVVSLLKRTRGTGWVWDMLAKNNT